MPVFQTNHLLVELEIAIRAIETTVENRFVDLPGHLLNQQPAPEQWSIAQCIEHLNTYGAYYLPQIEQAMERAKRSGSSAKPAFVSSWLGNYFAETMRPKADGTITLKMKAFKNHRPAKTLAGPLVLATFLEQQRQLRQLVQQAKEIDIEQAQVSISIAHWLKLSIGDTFRFLIAHEERHLVQAERVFDTLRQPTSSTLSFPDNARLRE